MPMARAICKCAKCGNEFEVSAYRPNRRDANSFEAWAVDNITECDDCRNARKQAQRDEENRKAAAAAAEMGYPELEGTEKQVAWANSIRESTISTLREHYLDPDAQERRPHYPMVYAFLVRKLLTRKSAGWWIEHQAYGDIRSIVRHINSFDSAAIEQLDSTLKALHDKEITLEQAKEALDREPAQTEPKKQEQPKEEEPKPSRPEAVPEKRRHDGSADIRIIGGTVTAIYDKNESFRDAVKAMGFSWKDGCWQLVTGEKTGTPENVAAELGSRLLNSGFAVRFDSEALLDLAVRGEYMPMCRRWVQSHSSGFYIQWPREDNHYYEAKSIPGARYEAPGVVVPERSWAAVIDFASKYGYRITAKAQEKLDRLAGASSNVAPAPVLEPEYDEKDVLKSGREVLPDLKDNV